MLKFSTRLTLIYIVISVIWILGSDKVVDFIFPHVASQLQSIKGIFFVFLSGALIFLLIRKFERSEEEARIRAQEAQFKAERATHAKTAFLSHMSHELRTPLNAIIGFTDLISLQTFGEIHTKYKEYLADISLSANLLLSLINELLDISAIEEGKRTLEKKWFPLDEVMSECEAIVHGKAQQKGVILRFVRKKSVSEIYADNKALIQILLNLISNAIKFTSEGGQVTVETACSPARVTVHITDTGIGIAPEHISSLMSPYSMVANDAHQSEQGWGLGLSITKSLVDLHDGEMKINSKLGKGTKVTVTLPQPAMGANS